MKYTKKFAVTDEYIQGFIPGRASGAHDIWVDFADACRGMIITVAIALYCSMCSERNVKIARHSAYEGP